jgi:hypothetical protein
VTLDQRIIPIVNEIFRRTREFQEKEEPNLAKSKLDLVQYMDGFENVVRTVSEALSHHPETFVRTGDNLEAGPTGEFLTWLLRNPTIRAAEEASQIIALIEPLNVIEIPRELSGNFRNIADWISQHKNRVSYVRWSFSRLPLIRIGKKKLKNEGWIHCQACDAFEICHQYDERLICLNCYAIKGER